MNGLRIDNINDCTMWPILGTRVAMLFTCQKNLREDECVYVLFPLTTCCSEG